MNTIAHPNILLDALENGVMIVDEEGMIHYWNRWLEVNTGYDHNEIYGKKLQDLYSQIDYSVLRRKIRTTLRLNTPTFYDTTFQNRFITIRRMKISGSRLPYMQMQVTISPYIIEQKMVMIAVYDISSLYELKLAMQEQRDQTEKLNRELQHDKKIIDDNLPIIKTDEELNIVEVSTAFSRISGFETEALLKSSIKTLYSDRMDKSQMEQMCETIQRRGYWNGEIELLLKNQQFLWMDVIATPSIDETGRFDGYTMIYHDISDKKRIELLAITDPLTSLYNRIKFDDVFRLMLLRENWEPKNTFAIILIDVDHFKKVNDVYGHLVGDQTLVKVAEVLRTTARFGDIVARWGGEEFIVLMQNVDDKKVLIAAEKLRANIESAEIPEVKKVTASLGVTLYQKGDTQQQMLQRADEGLYHAKTGGRNCIHLVP